MPAPASPAAPLAAFNAFLNTLAAVLLAAGRVAIKRRRIARHRLLMISAFAASSLFLCTYLYEHYRYGIVRFQGAGMFRDFYLALLGSHTILAVLVAPLAVVALYLAWRERFEKHKKIVRILWPAWMYVSVTGVAVYWMLFRL